MSDDLLFNQADLAYEEGDFKTAFQLFLKAAQNNNVDAMSRIACMYGDGEGVNRSYELSIQWDMKAIEMGNTSSLINLAITYRACGDIKRAKYWFEKSLASGDGDAALELAKLYMVSDKETDKVREYLNIAINNDNIIEASVEEAKNLLAELE